MLHNSKLIYILAFTSVLHEIYLFISSERNGLFTVAEFEHPTFNMSVAQFFSSLKVLNYSWKTHVSLFCIVWLQRPRQTRLYEPRKKLSQRWQQRLPRGTRNNGTRGSYYSAQLDAGIKPHKYVYKSVFRIRGEILSGPNCGERKNCRGRGKKHMFELMKPLGIAESTEAGVYARFTGARNRATYTHHASRMKRGLVSAKWFIIYWRSAVTLPRKCVRVANTHTSRALREHASKSIAETRVWKARTLPSFAPLLK